VDTIRNIPLADALVHLDDADEVFVRLALSSNDAGRWVCCSLVADILPERWLGNGDATLLAPWYADQDHEDAPLAWLHFGSLDLWQ
jgi:hypothetical protein